MTRNITPLILFGLTEEIPLKVNPIIMSFLMTIDSISIPKNNFGLNKQVIKDWKNI